MDIDSSLAILGAAGIGLILFFVLLGLAALVLDIIAWWKLFEKAGEKGWKIFIPVYNAYIQYKICWGTTPFWIYLCIAFAGGILNGIGDAAEISFLSTLSTFCSIALVVFSIIMCVKLAKAYGKDGGFAVGLVFLSTIFECILGFDSAQYIGPNGIPAGGAGPDDGYRPYQPQAAQQPVYNPQPNPAPYGYDPYTGQPLSAPVQSAPAQAPSAPQAPATPENAPQANPYDSYKSDF